MKRLAATLLLLAAAACGGGSPLSGLDARRKTSGQDGPSAPTPEPSIPNKPNDGATGGRPSETGEGLEGYLMDPSKVIFTETSSGTRVEILAGAVSGEQGKLATNMAHVYTTTLAALTATCRSLASEPAPLFLAERASAALAPDGSLSIVVANPDRSPLVVTIGEPLTVLAPALFPRAAVRAADSDGAGESLRNEPQGNVLCARFQLAAGAPTSLGEEGSMGAEGDDEFSAPRESGLAAFTFGASRLDSIHRWLGHSDCPTCPKGVEKRQTFLLHGAIEGTELTLVVKARFVSSGTNYAARSPDGSAEISAGANKVFPSVGPGAQVWKIRFVPKAAVVRLELYNGRDAGAHYLYVDRYSLERGP